MSWVSPADMAFAITSRGGTAATGTQWDKDTLNLHKIHFVLYVSVFMKHWFPYLNSDFISCATTSDDAKNE